MDNDVPYVIREETETESITRFWDMKSKSEIVIRIPKSELKSDIEIRNQNWKLVFELGIKIVVFIFAVIVLLLTVVLGIVFGSAKDMNQGHR